MTAPAPSPTVVREAARRVADAWTSEGNELTPADVARELETLVLLLQRDDAVPVRDLPSPPLGFTRRRLLEKLRAETVRIWAESMAQPSSTEMLQTMRAFERARSILDPRSELQSLDRNTPNGLELLEVAHDFRTPLTSIMYLSDSLRRGQSGDLNDLQRRQLGIVYNAALTLISTASDVIELTSAGENLVDSEPAVFSITETMESIYNVVQPIAEEKGLQVRLTPPREPLRVGNPVALSRVLLNLMTNALKFTDAGFVDIAAFDREDSKVQFTVRDTGCGISEEVLATLFEPFRRTAARDSGYYFSGSGLGLAICRKLVKAMGSDLQVETSVEHGTRFFFELNLPIASVRAAEVTPQSV